MSASKEGVRVEKREKRRASREKCEYRKRE